jgi:hypothetical protein
MAAQAAGSEADAAAAEWLCSCGEPINSGAAAAAVLLAVANRSQGQAACHPK